MSEEKRSRLRRVAPWTFVGLVTVGYALINRPWVSCGEGELFAGAAPLVELLPGSLVPRNCTPANPIDPARGSVRWEYAWRSELGRIYEPEDVAVRISNALFRCGVLTTWPDSGSIVNGAHLKSAPFRFALVSIEPIVVLMPIETQTRYGFRSDEPVTFYLPMLSNPLEVGLQLPGVTECSWFAPDSGDPPAPLDLISGSAVIPGMGVRVERMPEGLSVSTVR